MLRKLVLGGALFAAWLSACGTTKSEEFGACKPGDAFCACRADASCNDGFVCNQRHQCVRDDGAAGAQGEAGDTSASTGGKSGTGGKGGGGTSTTGGAKSTGGSSSHRGGKGGKGGTGATSTGGDAGTGETLPSTGGTSLGGTGPDPAAGGAGETGASGAGQGGESGSGGTGGDTSTGGTLSTGGTAGDTSVGGSLSGGTSGSGGIGGTPSSGGIGGTPSSGGMSGASGLGGAAGTPGAGAGGKGGGGDDCIEITRGEVAFTDLGNAPRSAIYAFHADATHEKTPLGDADVVDYLEVQFYASSFNPIDNGEETGTFELGTGIDANFETCARCLLIDEDVPTQGKPHALYFATEGSMIVADTSQQMTGAPNLTLSKVTFREVLIDQATNESTLVPGGRCVYLESAGID